MKLVYIDESEQAGKLYLFGGLVVDEEQCRSISDRMNGLASRVLKDYPDLCSKVGSAYDLEFHAANLAQGKSYWHSVDRSYRIEAIYLELIKILRDEKVEYYLNGINIPFLERLYQNPYPPRDLALAHLLGTVQKEVEGNLIALADDHYTKKNSRLQIESLRHYSSKAYCRDPLDHYLDTVFFGDSMSSRLIQASDMVTYLYSRRWNPVTNRFDREETKEWYEKMMRKLLESTSQITAGKSVYPYY